MPRGSQPDITEATRQKIISGFLQCSRRATGANVTVSSVCREAKISRNTFYRYFKNIDALLVETIAEYSAISECFYIIQHSSTIPLERATDLVATFYEKRSLPVRILVSGRFRDRYLHTQVNIMAPMFRALIARALDLTPLQLDYIAELIARSRAEMIDMWVARGQKMSLNQMNKLCENVVEKELWTAVALQAPHYGGPKERIEVERHSFDYPWIAHNNEQ